MTEKLSLIAGSGALVTEVIAAAQGRGYALQVLTSRARGGLRGAQTVPFRLSDPDSAVAAIRDFGTTMIAMAGGLQLSDVAREGFARFFGAVGGPSLGDGSLSSLAERLTEITGARLVGVQEIAPDLLAPEGLIAGPAPDPALSDTGAFALNLARHAGSLDLGQAVVVAGRRPIGVEDISGTDALLRRVRGYRLLGFVTGGRSPLVLAKAAKPAQPHYVDLPAIGPVTVVRAKRAGIRLIAVQAGATILIERQKLTAAAERAGIPVVGFVAADD